MFCASCGQETAPALFCHACDAYLTSPKMGLKASVARRFGALLLDSLAIWVFFFVIFLLSAGLGASTGRGDVGVWTFVVTFFWASVAYIVFALWFLSKGKTPGKWLVGIRAADKSHGSLPGLGRMLVRETVGKFLSGLFFGFGYFWAIFDKDAQAWHDKIAGTVVLRQPVSSAAVGSTVTAGLPTADRAERMR